MSGIRHQSKMVWRWIKSYRQDSTDTIRTENSIKAKDMAEYFFTASTVKLSGDDSHRRKTG